MKEGKRDKGKYYEIENEDGETNERKKPKVCRQFISQSFELKSSEPADWLVCSAYETDMNFPSIPSQLLRVPMSVERKFMWSYTVTSINK
jgi:hypothetical protein